MIEFTERECEILLQAVCTSTFLGVMAAEIAVIIAKLTPVDDGE